MKKWLLVLSCVCAFSLVAMIPLTCFADDRPEYEYTITYFPSDSIEFDEHYPTVNLNLSRPLILAGQTWNVGEDVRLDFSSYGNLVIGVYNPLYEEDPNEYEFLSRYEYLTVNDLPIVFYSYSPTLARTDGAVISGTLVVPETTVPETTSAPSAYGSSVTDGLTSGISYVGLVLSSILNSPVFIFVGLAVGCYLVTLSISKVKDLIKGY